MGIRIQNIIIALLASIFGANGAQASIDKSGLGEKYKHAGLPKDLKLSKSDEIKLQKLAQSGQVFDLDGFLQQYSTRAAVVKPRRVRRVRRNNVRTNRRTNTTPPTTVTPKANNTKFSSEY